MKSFAFLALPVLAVSSSAFAQSSAIYPVEDWSAWKEVSDRTHGVVVESRARNYNRPYGTEIEYRITNRGGIVVDVTFHERVRRCADGSGVSFGYDQTSDVADNLAPGESVTVGGGGPDCNGSGGVVSDGAVIHVVPVRSAEAPVSAPAGEEDDLDWFARGEDTEFTGEPRVDDPYAALGGGSGAGNGGPSPEPGAPDDSSGNSIDIVPIEPVSALPTVVTGETSDLQPIEPASEGDMAACVNLNIAVTERMADGSRWDGVLLGARPDIRIKEARSGFALTSKQCDQSLSCSVTIEAAGDTLELLIEDFDSLGQNEIIGAGSCPLGLEICQLGQATIRLSHCS